MFDRAETIAGLVTIVTPCLDGEVYLQETIRSILAQTYPAIEYLFIDGGSRDASVAIARSFGERVEVSIAAGASQTRATNVGFRASRGEYFLWLGADDLLAPDAVARLVIALSMNAEAPFAYGRAEFVDYAGELIGEYPTRQFDRKLLAETCYISQPATLSRARDYAANGGVDERLHAAFDYDLWIRLSRNATPAFVPIVLAQTRMHYQTKTYRSRLRNLRETRALVLRHYGYVPFSWEHAFAGVLVTGGDMFFDPPRGSFARTLLTLVIGLKDNFRSAGRYIAEFRSEIVRLRGIKRRRAAP